jgi:rod shape-determining protein MreD
MSRLTSRLMAGLASIRWPVMGVLLVVALVLQVTFFPHLAVHGVVPNLCLLVVVGYVAGRVRSDAGSSPVAALVTVAASSFIGTSVFALSGLVLQDPVVSVADLLPVVLLAVGWDVLLAPLLLPGLMRLFEALEPVRVRT